MNVRTGRRAITVVTCGVLTALLLATALLTWAQAERVIAVVSAMLGVLALAVGTWALTQAPREDQGEKVRASQTGRAAGFGKRSRANSGVRGASASLERPLSAENTGDAIASDGGEANSGVDIRE